MTPTDGTSARRLRAWLLAERMAFTTEAELQSAIAGRLDAELAIGQPITAYTRELRVDDRNRLDFSVTLAGTRIAVEVKIAGSNKDVLRQLTRYAALPDVDEILLVTTKANHHRMPTRINDKPVVLCSLVEVGL